VKPSAVKKLQTQPEKPNESAAVKHWGTYRTAETLRDHCRLEFDESLGRGANGECRCRRSSRSSLGGAGVGSENDGSCGLCGAGIFLGLRGIRCCGRVSLGCVVNLRC
jgi:hypothetical protein